MKRKLVTFLLVGFVGVLIANPLSIRVVEAQKKILDFASFHSDPAPKEAIEAGIKLFEQENPSIKVNMNIMAHEAFKKQIRLWLTAANPPDVLTWFTGERAFYFAKQGVVADFTDLWDKEGWDKTFGPFKTICKFHDKAYVLPLWHDWESIWYRKSLFEEYGLEEPITWREFLNVCEKFKGSGITPISIGTKYRWTAAGWFDAIDLKLNGLDFHMRLMRGEESYTDPRVYKVFELWKELVEKGYFLENAAAYSWQEEVPFVVRKEAAMCREGGYFLEAVPEEAKPDFDFFAPPIIDGTIPRAEEACSSGFMMSKNAPHPEVAKIFLKFMASEKSQRLICEKAGRIAPNVNVPLEIYSPIVKQAVRMVRRAEGVAQFYDRDTSPPIADKGMDAFMEFMRYPARYKQILKTLQEEVEKVWEKLE